MIISLQFPFIHLRSYIILYDIDISNPFPCSSTPVYRAYIVLVQFNLMHSLSGFELLNCFIHPPTSRSNSQASGLATRQSQISRARCQWR